MRPFVERINATPEAEEIPEGSQRELARLRAESFERVVGLLAERRTSRMEVQLDPRVEREASELLIQWFEWEMAWLEGEPSP